MTQPQSSPAAAAAANKPSQHLRVFVLGTGGVGGYYAAKLSKVASVEVTLICRSDYDVVKKNGITISSVDHPDQDDHFMPAAVLNQNDISKEKEMLQQTPDVLLIALKVLPDMINVPKLIAPYYVGPNTAIALMQNGVEIEEPIAKAFPTNELISIIAMIGVVRTRPGHVQHLGSGKLIMGTFSPENGNNKKTKALAEAFVSAGVDCTVSEEITTRRWIKVVWNGSFNPLSVLAGGATTRELLADEVSEENIRGVMLEVWKVATAVGCGFDQTIIDGIIERCRNSFDYKTSMLVDFENKRPMEVEAILGNIVRAAKRVQVDVPRISSMYASLRLLDRKNRQTKDP